MSSQSNNSDAAVAFGVVGAACMFMAAFIFAFFAFLSLLLTIASLAAWNQPRTFFGNTITPDEARKFVIRGVSGALLIPAFAAFSSGLFDYLIDDEAWLYLVILGYSLGSLGIAILEAKAEEEATAAAPARYITLPQEPLPTPSSSSSPDEPTHSEPFHFATWDDEEELRK
ncbi:hypothetical protein NGM99_17195 [Mesorhizobium sp. RP14(2022)]|uniref:Uncharacterized protein n=1 Tax=Mesorhizobium liriopis TaxID=2953882 RepID=A0ABT1CA12_9HYPH|nr:hypothetical protein [Mesorhizobium liriopis]MCO6051523.1 hypothetical protein [Mesorhizobium liriopis]